MGIRVAPAVLSIFKQANDLYPARSRASDGTIGDSAHRHRKSDHNPNARGIVLAGDLTNDPGDGINAHEWIRWRVRTGDRRIRYAISDSEMWTAESRRWVRYDGENPHVKHAHVSVFEVFAYDTSPWFAGFHSAPAPAPGANPAPTPQPPRPQWPIEYSNALGEDEDVDISFVQPPNTGVFLFRNGVRYGIQTPKHLQTLQFLAKLSGVPSTDVQVVSSEQFEILAQYSINGDAQN